MVKFDLLSKFSPTIKDFIVSRKTITILIAPLGEGKTIGCVGAMLYHAGICGIPVRFAIIRDTLENIKLSIVPSIQEFFQIMFPDDHLKLYRFKNEYKELTIFTNPRIDIDLFGIDDPTALGKLQGSSAYSLIWLNEPCPIASKANAGISEETYNTAVIRAMRRTATPGRVICDMNPGDEDHWSFRRFVQEADFDPEFPLITKGVWWVPYGENTNLKEEARQAAKVAFKHDEASYSRYVKGEFASIYRGPKVTPQYKRERHLCEDSLTPAPGLVSFAIFDSWHTPCVCLGQISSTGRLVFLDTLRLENSDVRTLLETKVGPLLNSPRWKNKAFAWRIGGDFTMAQPDQSNKRESAAKVVQEWFQKFLNMPHLFFESGPSKWETGKRHMAAALQGSDHLGDSLIILSKDNRLLDRALNGAWHYKMDNSGNIHKSAKPEKDMSSHPGDCFFNAVSILLPSISNKVDLSAYRRAAARSRARVQTYAVSGVR